MLLAKAMHREYEIFVFCILFINIRIVLVNGINKE